MNPLLQRTMRDAISNVLETMFFLVPGFVENQGVRAFERRPFFLESSISLATEVERLKLVFGVTRSYITMITANFLGVGQKEVAAEQMEDTLKEFTNMVGGDLLSRMPSINWELGIPELKQPEAVALEPPGPNVYTVVLSFDEEPMAVAQLYGDQG